MQGFKWDGHKERAAALVATGVKTDVEIASEAGVNSATLWRWKSNPEFQARVNEHLSVVREDLKTGSLADRQFRVDLYTDLMERIQVIMRARSLDMVNVPGGKSGLLVRSFKAVGRGEAQKIVEEYAFDRALASELKELAKQTAQDLGQWTESRDMDAWAKFIDYTKLTDEQVERIANGEHPLKVVLGIA